MRIAHIDTERTWRGGQQQVLSLCEALDRKGHYNWIVSRTDGALAKRLSNLRFSHIGANPRGEWDLFSAAVLRQRLLDERIDVVHAHTGHGVAFAAASTLGTAIPIVATRRVDFHLCQNPFSRWKYGRVSKIAAVSACVRNILIEDGIPAEKITVVPDGIDFRRFDALRPHLKQDIGVPPESMLIGLIAALVPHKDPLTFLDAFAILHKTLPHVRAVVLGDGELRRAMDLRIKNLKLGSSVRMLGFRADVLNYLASFDIFCLSSVEEGLCTSILDAMALNVPVVATRAGGIPELIADGETGYLAEAHQPASLAKALAEAIVNRPNNKSILDRAYQKSKEFDIARTADETERLYAASLERRPARAMPTSSIEIS